MYQPEIARLTCLFVFFSVLPTIRARKSDVNATADIGGFALLACDADGFPEPTVTWAQYVTFLLWSEQRALHGGRIN